MTYLMHVGDIEITCIFAVFFGYFFALVLRVKSRMKKEGDEFHISRLLKSKKSWLLFILNVFFVIWVFVVKDEIVERYGIYLDLVGFSFESVISLTALGFASHYIINYALQKYDKNIHKINSFFDRVLNGKNGTNR